MICIVLSWTLGAEISHPSLVVQVIVRVSFNKRIWVWHLSDKRGNMIRIAPLITLWLPRVAKKTTEQKTISNNILLPVDKYVTISFDLRLDCASQLFHNGGLDVCVYEFSYLPLVYRGVIGRGQYVPIYRRSSHLCCGVQWRGGSQYILALYLSVVCERWGESGSDTASGLPWSQGREGVVTCGEKREVTRRGERQEGDETWGEKREGGERSERREGDKTWRERVTRFGERSDRVTRSLVRREAGVSRTQLLSRWWKLPFYLRRCELRRKAVSDRYPRLLRTYLGYVALHFHHTPLTGS